MIGLSDSERITMIRSAVLIQITRVTDGRTDGIGVVYNAVARKTNEYATRIPGDSRGGPVSDVPAASPACQQRVCET